MAFKAAESSKRGAYCKEILPGVGQTGLDSRGHWSSSALLVLRGKCNFAGNERKIIHRTPTAASTLHLQRAGLWPAASLPGRPRPCVTPGVKNSATTCGVRLYRLGTTTTHSPVRGKGRGGQGWESCILRQELTVQAIRGWTARAFPELPSDNMVKKRSPAGLESDTPGAAHILNQPWGRRLPTQVPVLMSYCGLSANHSGTRTCLRLDLWLSCTSCWTHTHTLTHTHAHGHTCSHTHRCSHSPTHAYTLTCVHTHTLTCSLTRTHTHAHMHSHAHTLTHANSHRCIELTIKSGH